MTTTIRRRRLAGAIAVPIAVIALGMAAWNDAGEQAVGKQTIAVPLPPEAPTTPPEAPATPPETAR